MRSIRTNGNKGHRIIMPNAIPQKHITCFLLHRFRPSSQTCRMFQSSPIRQGLGFRTVPNSARIRKSEKVAFRRARGKRQISAFPSWAIYFDSSHTLLLLQSFSQLTPTSGTGPFPFRARLTSRKGFRISICPSIKL